MQPNAYVRFINELGNYERKYIWVMSVEQRHSLSASSSQAASYQHFYIKSNQQGPLVVQGRVPDQDHYNALAEIIRKHQQLVVKQRGQSNLVDGGLSFMRLAIPSENLYVDGLITGFLAGQKRFNPAPPFTFNMQVVRDHGSTDDIYVGRAINDYFHFGVENLELDKSRITDKLETLDQDYNPIDWPTLPPIYKPHPGGGGV